MEILKVAYTVLLHRYWFINGRVSGDVVCLAFKVIINGEIGQDLRIAGSDISLKGKVNGFAVAWCIEERLIDRVRDDADCVLGDPPLDE